MQIAFLTSEYPHPKVLHAAGIATSIKNLAVTLVKKGVDVTVFVYHQNENAIVTDEGVMAEVMLNIQRIIIKLVITQRLN